MAAPYNPPVKNEDFQMMVSLEDALNPGSFKANPTLAAGDAQISKDGGAFANLTNLPGVSPALKRQLQVDLTNTEMNADNVVIQLVDQTTPKEWNDLIISIPTTA